mmetsp:Transcript_7901/g.18504  ORF Transcript_7901/g.18504 Transcript_7901/m.18504 type:complete len:413 (+) Transcript_7901:63-1301(+)
MGPTFAAARARGVARARRQSLPSLSLSNDSGLAPESVNFVCIIWLLVCLGVSVFGITLICEGQEDKLADTLHAYTEIVETWSSTGLYDFLDLNVTAELHGQVWTLRPDEEEPALHSQVKLPQYRSLRYFAADVPLFLNASSIPWTAAEVNITLNLTIRAAADAAVSRLVVGPFQAARHNYVHANHKKCYYQLRGTFEEEQCQLFYRLTEICIKVSRKPGNSAGDTGGWYLDESGGDIGCEPSVDQDWTPFHYEKVSLQAAPAGKLYWHPPPSSYKDGQAILLQVRSTADPLLGAMAINGGTRDFPPSKDYLIGSGIALIVSGLLLTIFSASIWWQSKRHPPQFQEPLLEEAIGILQSPGSHSAPAVETPHRLGMTRQRRSRRQRDRNTLEVNPEEIEHDAVEGRESDASNPP